MKSPIGQRTLLSIAVAASLACISGGSTLASGSVKYCIGDDCTEGSANWVTVASEDIGDNLVLYDPDPVSTETGETIPTILTTLPESGEITLSIEGTGESTSLLEDIEGTVYGIAAASEDVIDSKANLTINVTNAEIDGRGEDSHRAGNPDSILYGVYAAEKSDVTFGDVTINIKNSILGSSDDSYNDVVIGARASDDALLTVGNVKLTVDDETVSGGYSRIIGVKQTSSKTITTGNIEVEITGNENTVVDRVIGYSQNQFEQIHPTGNAFIGDVTVTISETGSSTPTVFGYVFGCDIEWMVKTVEIGDIVVDVSNIKLAPEASSSSGETAILGLNTRNASGQLGDTDITETVVTADSVSVKAKNIDDSGTSSFRAIEKFDAGTVTVNGAVSLAAEKMSTDSHSINAISVGGGTLNISGLTSMYVKDVNSLNIYGFRAEFYEGTSPSETEINATMNGIDLVYVSTTSDYKVTKNIYGAATETNGDDHINTIKTGDISVTIAGSAKEMGFKADGGEYDGFKSIYGTVAGSGTIDHGTRTLVFGYEGTDIDGNASTVTFDSTVDNPFNATFSNFDEVVVKSGSSLYLTSSQKGFNFEDGCGSFFDTGDEADDHHSLWSEDGVLYLVKTSGLTIEEGGLADIMIVVNNGAIEVNGALTTYTSSKEFLIIEGDEQTDITCTSSNAGTISGTGTLTIAKGTIDGFENTGTISV